MTRRAALVVFLGLCSCSTSPAQTQGFGLVFAQSTPALAANSPVGGSASASALVFAQFTRNPDTMPSCTKEHLSAACDLLTCASVSPVLDAGAASMTDAGVAPTTDLHSAGVITLSGGREPVSLVPEGGVYSGYLAFQQPLWDGGESLNFHAAGGEVPGFDVTLVGPAQPTMMQPIVLLSPSVGVLEFDASATPKGSTVSRAQDLVFQWTGGTPSTSLEVDLGAGGSSVRCIFDAGAGMGVIPSAFLSRLSSGAGTLFGDIYSTATVNGADWTTTVVAHTVIADMIGRQWPAGPQGGLASIELQ